jgi:XTP/dITP diphosphohydrolase
MMLELLLATTNPGKLREMRALLASLPPHIQLVTPADLGLHLEVEEDGQTYAENASLKAVAFCHASQRVTLADDSGLEVEALYGAPGLHSARYAPQPGATDADRRARLLAALQGAPHPWRARFRCVIAITTPDGAAREKILTTEGICPGEIIPQERGSNGFGYDPIFLLPEKNLTMAELSMADKNLLSHRARAVQAALPILIDIFTRDVR